MTADAENVAERANDAMSQIPTLEQCLACVDCSRLFRTGQSCPYCASESLLNVADIISNEHIGERLRDARLKMEEQGNGNS